MNNIIKKLEDNSISVKEKEKYLTNNKLIFKLKLYLLSVDDIIYLLFKSNIANNLKILICEMVDKLSERKKEEINFSFLNYSNDKFDINLLRCKYVPLIIKTRIVNTYEISNIVKILNNKEESLNLKKLIIDIIFNDSNLIIRSFGFYYNVLNDIISKDIINYIIDNKIKDKPDTMLLIVKYSNNIEIKKRIINKYVTTKNILNILEKSSFINDVEKIIIELKSNELKRAIKKAHSKKLYDILYNKKVSPFIENMIFNQSKRKLYLYCLIQPIVLNFDRDIFYEDDGNPKLRELMYKTHPIRLLLYILMFLNMSDVIDWLISSSVNEKLKKFIYIIKWPQLQIRCRLIDMYSIKKYVKKDYNNHYYYEIMHLILKYRKKYILKNLNKMDHVEIIDFLSRCENQEFKDLIIKNCINKDNISYFLISNISLSEQMIEYIIINNADLIINRLKQIDDDQIFRLNLLYPALDNNIRNLIVKNNQSFFKEKLKKFDYDILIKKLKSDSTLKTIKLLIIENFGYEDSDSEIIRQLMKKCDVDYILNYYNLIKDLFKKLNIDINFFNQYGIGTLKYKNWEENLISIIKENNQEEFIKIKNYFFNNYYNEFDKENMVYDISNFLEILSNYNRAKELFKDMSEKNIVLTADDKKNLDFFFKICSEYIPNKFEELKNYRYKIYEENKNKIQDGISLYNACALFDELFFTNIKNSLNQIGGVSGLKILQLSNKDSKTINELSSEIILYSKIINLINNIKDVEQINDVLRTIFSSYEQFEKIQNMFLNIDEKIQKLYELDSQINLTKIDNIKYLDDVVDENFSLKYGGKVYDFSNKNYCLYAHVLSSRENIQDLMLGISTFKSNFISLSPISYKGQKYYYNNCDLILAFDKIPTGSFICSSIKNMGSNGYVTSNSSEIANALTPIQRGILETSAVINQNSETLLYREGLIPCGIILPNGKEPSSRALKYHKEYNLPFIITQPIEEAIENPQKIFEINDNYTVNTNIKSLNELVNMLSSKIYINKENDIYTGRRIAIITDSHALYEPTLEVLEDIRNKGINEIYSLGDNIGSGPNPAEIIDLLDSYNVKSVAGNSEYYMTLGTNPFEYLDKDRIENEEWTYDKLGQSRIERLKLYPPSYEIMLGDKKVALCHFINDIRWNFDYNNSTWNFQNQNKHNNPPTQFYYTNSKEAQNQIEFFYKKNNSKYAGYKSAHENPLFGGKSIRNFDEVIQGHVHFDIEDKLDNILIHTLRAVGMGFKDNGNNTACYYVLKEKKSGGFDKEKVLVPFNRNYLLSNIITSSLPHKGKILKYLD